MRDVAKQLREEHLIQACTPDLRMPSPGQLNVLIMN